MTLHLFGHSISLKEFVGVKVLHFFWIKAHREAAGYNQSQFVSKINIKKSKYAELEKQTGANISYADLQEISSALNITIDMLRYKPGEYKDPLVLEKERHTKELNQLKQSYEEKIRELQTEIELGEQKRQELSDTFNRFMKRFDQTLTELEELQALKNK